ncbi:MAG: hypothetical protein U1E62_26600 [Alsobacter sp.]
MFKPELDALANDVEAFRASTKTRAATLETSIAAAISTAESAIAEAKASLAAHGHDRAAGDDVDEAEVDALNATIAAATHDRDEARRASARLLKIKARTVA